MKIKRLKKVQKHLEFYVNNYKFRKPFQILIDGTFTFAALENKFNIEEQLTKYLQSEVKLLTTQCVVLEMEKLGFKHNNSLLILKKFGIHKCGHEKAPVCGSKCFLSMVGRQNQSRYIIATQDRDLQNTFRNSAGVPLIYLHQKVPILEPPSQLSQENIKKNIEKNIITEDQERIIQKLRVEANLFVDKKFKQLKRKKVKGPNPLSCKKKKKKSQVKIGDKKN